MKFEEKVEPGPVFGPPQASRTMYQPMASRQVRQWFSPSLSYVQLPRPEFPHTCGQRLTLNVPYTTRKDTHTAFQYQVFCLRHVMRFKILYQFLELILPNETNKSALDVKRKKLGIMQMPHAAGFGSSSSQNNYKPLHWILVLG